MTINHTRGKGGQNGTTEAVHLDDEAVVVELDVSYLYLQMIAAKLPTVTCEVQHR